MTRNLTDRICLIQMIVLLALAFIFYLIKEDAFFKGFLLSSIIFPLYLQLLWLTSKNINMMLINLPLRILVTGIPAAILVHKFQVNLIALLLGFVINQIIYVIFTWRTYNNRNIRTESSS